MLRLPLPSSQLQNSMENLMNKRQELLDANKANRTLLHDLQWMGNGNGMGMGGGGMGEFGGMGSRMGQPDNVVAV